MTQQTNALRLADALDAPTISHHQVSRDWEPYETATKTTPAPLLHCQAADELRRLDAENAQLKKSLALVQQHHATAWSRGHAAGIRASSATVKQATDAVKSDAWGNTQLTDALLAAEAERDQLRDEVARLKELVGHLAVPVGHELVPTRELKQLRAQVERLQGAIKNTINHWQEFGPEHGFDEAVYHLEKASASFECNTAPPAAPALAPFCHVSKLAIKWLKEGTHSVANVTLYSQPTIRQETVPMYLGIGTDCVEG